MQPDNRFHAVTLLAIILIFGSSCVPVEISVDVQGTPLQPFRENAQEEIVLVFSPGDTATPFMPLPVTGTPPPTSTPFPTAQPTPTLTATPWLQPTFAPPSVPVYGIPPPFPLLSPGHQINFLLLGSDSRGGGSFRTDVIMIVIVDPAEKQVTLISLPRDLYVYIPGWTMQRINTAYQHGESAGYQGGGMGLIRDTIRYNLGIRIDHVALVDFDGFRRIVDTAGGIDVPLLCPFTEWAVIDPNVSIEYESNWELTTIGPGVVHMDGATALWYARARMRSNDFDRGRRQQELIRALFSAAVAKNLILQAPQLYEDYIDTVVTDVSLQTILSLVPLGLELNEARIRSYYIGDELTWGWMTPGGANVLLPNEEKIYNMLIEALSPQGSTEEPPNRLVEIWNWSSHPDWGQLAAERLHYAGFETLLLPDYNQKDQSTTLYAFEGQADQSTSQDLLDLLGLPGSRLDGEPSTGSEAAYRLVIGDDYEPCYDPTER